MLKNIPVMNLEDRNVARRFILLVFHILFNGRLMSCTIIRSSCIVVQRMRLEEYSRFRIVIIRQVALLFCYGFR